MHFTIPISQRLNKLIRSLQQKKFRDQNGMFVAEGEKLCDELYKSDFETELLVIRDYPSAETVRLAEAFSEKMIPVYTAPKTQFDQLTNVKSPQGILAVAYKKENKINPDEPFIALDAVSDPGNVGTIVRTSEWFGISQVILGRDCADKYNPKTVRASMGALFKSTIVVEVDLAGYIKEIFPKHQIFGAMLDSDNKLRRQTQKKKFGIIFGNEAKGISPEVAEIVNKDFTIKGIGSSESLNVAVSVGISLYHFSTGKK